MHSVQNDGRRRDGGMSKSWYDSDYRRPRLNRASAHEGTGLGFAWDEPIGETEKKAGLGCGQSRSHEVERLLHIWREVEEAVLLPLNC